MTLSIAWIRQSDIGQELIFASDSRLSGGGHVDQCQKVFPLPREDCCIAFAGSTMIAYPFILQLQNAILQYNKLLDRAIDLVKVKARVVSLLNFFVRVHEGTITEDFERDLKETSFIFGGWSWVESRFYIWKIVYRPDLQRYISVRTEGARITAGKLPIAAIGDYLPHFHAALRRKIGEGAGPVAGLGEPPGLAYQPLTVLSEMLCDARFTDRKRELKGKIGGAPQVTSVHPYMRTTSFAVEWDVGEKFIYSIKGRVIADFELFTIPGIDPFTGEVRPPLRSSIR